MSTSSNLSMEYIIHPHTYAFGQRLDATSSYIITVLWEKEEGTFRKRIVSFSFFCLRTAGAVTRLLREVSARDGGQHLKFDFSIELVSTRMQLYLSTVTIILPFLFQRGWVEVATFTVLGGNTKTGMTEKVTVDLGSLGRLDCPDFTTFSAAIERLANILRD